VIFQCLKNSNFNLNRIRGFPIYFIIIVLRFIDNEESWVVQFWIKIIVILHLRYGVIFIGKTSLIIRNCTKNNRDVLGKEIEYLSSFLQTFFFKIFNKNES